MLRQVLTVLCLALALPAASDPGPARARILAERLSSELQPGDLVFKGASTAVWTELAASWSEGDKRWGHVGLVVSTSANGGVATVVHADTGTGDPDQTFRPGEEIGAVRAVPLEVFLGDVDQAGLFHLRLTPEARARMLDWANAQAAARIPFDRGYSLESANNLYCTELIWRAMSEGLGHDAIPEKSHRLGRTYVALSDLSQHQMAKEVLVLDMRPTP